MATVTVTGGPFTDSLGNAQFGDFEFMPVPNVDDLAYDLIVPVTGTLGGISTLQFGVTGPAVQFEPGSFSVTLPYGTYDFKLRMPTQYFNGQITLDDTVANPIDIVTLVNS